MSKTLHDFSHIIMSDDARLHRGDNVHSLASRLLRPNDERNNLGTGYKAKFLNGPV